MIKTTFYVTAAILAIASVNSVKASSCSPTTHAKLPVINGKSYHKARKSLLAVGWQPLRSKPLNQANEDPDISYGNGMIFWDLGYREVESCSGTGLAPCSFLFQDAYGNKLRVITEGEESPKDKAVASVSSYKFTCE
ncbi:hypothetical protein [Undibacterium aquatile]|uniref:Uncharacterized protein n=1 Tax=Undibacterium aquatile TaxID=1537398 RepID=A0ABR6XB13_9BURK|nr:hypothetical protein [Undibacterium aquatile]MBC3809873.1 hypothetical protein [Undibacterium aquatile]